MENFVNGQQFLFYWLMDIKYIGFVKIITIYFINSF
jgi:hypothetical protein